MESLQDLQMRKEPEWSSGRTSTISQYPEAKSEFQELGELFSPRELRNLHEHGGNLFQPVVDSTGGRTWLIPEGASNGVEEDSLRAAKGIKSSLEHSISLTGVYRNVRCRVASTYQTYSSHTYRLSFTVPPNPTIPIPPRPLHLPLPPHPRYPANILLLPHRRIART